MMVFFDYIKNTPCIIDGKTVQIRCHNGMTGIGSMEFYINDVKQNEAIIICSENIAKGEHIIFHGWWGERPWDDCFFLVSSADEKEFMQRCSDAFNKGNMFKTPKRCVITKENWLAW